MMDITVSLWTLALIVLGVAIIAFIMGCLVTHNNLKTAAKVVGDINAAKAAADKVATAMGIEKPAAPQPALVIHNAVLAARVLENASVPAQVLLNTTPAPVADTAAPAAEKAS